MSDEKKILRTVEYTERGCDFMFYCPACKCGHAIWTKKHNRLGVVWKFNGNMEKPTFEPSLLLKFVEYPPVDPVTGDYAKGSDGEYLKGEDGRLLGCKDAVCHIVVTDGILNYQADCTHELAGKAIPMEAF